MFYRHYAGDPYYNMGFDEWLFAHACQNPGWIGLRAYTWSEGAITIGLNQRPELAVDMSQLGETAIIRRVTGGRALYHEPSELTYSIAVNTDGLTHSRLTGSSSDNLALISEVLVSFLAACGLKASYIGRSSKEESQRQYFHKASCFASHARYEVVCDDHKIIASAQRRIDPTLFQHGSIKLGGVVDHPSVPVGDWVSSNASAPPGLTSASFNAMAETFGKVFENGLEVAFSEPEDGSEKTSGAVTQRILEVRKKPLERRDIF